MYLEQKNHSEAITSFNTAIRLALETEDSEDFVRATEKQLKEARRLAEQQQEEEAKQRDQKLQQEYDEWIRGKWKDSQILNLEKTSGGMAYTRAQISNGTKILTSRLAWLTELVQRLKPWHRNITLTNPVAVSYLSLNVENARLCSIL